MGLSLFIGEEHRNMDSGFREERPGLIAYSATFALKAGWWFLRGLLLMVFS